VRTNANLKGRESRTQDRARRHTAGKQIEKFKAGGKDVGEQDMGVGSAFASWDRELRARAE
jgi:hypothetical protein